MRGRVGIFVVGGDVERIVFVLLFSIVFYFVLRLGVLEIRVVVVFLVFLD